MKTLNRTFLAAILMSLAAFILIFAVIAHAEWTPPPMPVPPYLIIIPPVSDGYEVLVDAPLSRWQQADSWPTWEQCTQALQRFPGDYMGRLALSGAEVDYGAILWQSRHATCVASNDPRLHQ